MAKNLQLKVMLDTVDRATKNLRTIAKGSTGAAEAIRSTREHLKSLDNAQKDLDGFRNLKRRSEETATSLTDQEEKVRALSRQIQNAEGSTRRLTQQKNAAIRQAKKLKKQYGDEQQQLQDLRGTMRRVDGVTGSLSDQQKELSLRIEKANKRLHQQKTAMERLGKARLGDRFSKLTASIGRFGRRAAIAGTAAGGFLGFSGHSFASQAEEVGQWSARLGIASERLSALQYVGSQFGVQGEAMIDALKELSLRTDEFAVTGKGPAAEAFERLGLGAMDLNAVSNDTAALFDLVLGRIREIDNVAARQRIVDELFGGTGGEQMAELASASADELARLNKEASTLGVVFGKSDIRNAKDYMRAWRGVSGAMLAVRNTVGREVAPVLESLFQAFKGWVTDNRDRVQDFARTMGENLKKAVPVAINLGKSFGTMAAALASGATVLAGWVGGFDNLGMIMAAMVALKPVLLIASLAKGFVTAGIAVWGLVTSLDAAGAALYALKAALITTGIGALIVGIATAGYFIYKEWDRISESFSGIWSRIKEAFSDGLAGITKLLLEWSPAGIIAKIGGSMIDRFKNVLGINSPSRVFAKLGENTMEGYQQGIRRGERGPLRQVQGIAKRIGRAGAGVALGGAMATSAAAGLPASIGVDSAGLGNIGIDTRAPLSASRRDGLTVYGGINIEVNATPGMDENALANQVAAEVQRALAEAENRSAARQRSAFHDID